MFVDFSKVETKIKQFLDTDQEHQAKDWKIISNHFDNLTHLRITANEISGVGVQVRHETVVADEENLPNSLYDVQSIFIPGAQLNPTYNAQGQINGYKIGNKEAMKDIGGGR